MTQNYRLADSKGSKKLSEQKITKRSSPPLHFLSKFLYLCSFIFIFIACDTNASSTSSTSISSPDLSSWTKVETTGVISPARADHSSVILGNDIYVIGGSDGTNRLDDVWKSADGITWKQIAETRFIVRSEHSSVVLGSDIYVIGGFDGTTRLDDVWKSADGITWTKVTTTPGKIFPARSRHSSVILGNDIYIIGGSGNSSLLNDVWKSSDRGITWEKVTTDTSTKFSIRSTYSSVVLENNIYVIGGFDGTKSLNDVWKSADGKTWKQVATTKFPARSGHSSAVIGSEIYVIGGLDSTNSLNDVWKSNDKGFTWTQVKTTGTIFSARVGHSSVVKGSRVYVIGGFNGTSTQFDDVWVSR